MGLPRTTLAAAALSCAALSGPRAIRAQSVLAMRVADDSARIAPVAPVRGEPASPERRRGAIRRLVDAADARGVSATSSLTHDASVHRGPRGDASATSWPARGRALATASVEADLGRLAGLAGTRAFVGWSGLSGADQTEALGAAHGGTSIDATPFRAIGEAWLEQTVGDERLRVRVGRLDAGGAFGVSSHTGRFQTPAAGVDPTIALMPTYPAPTPGAHGLLRLGRRASIGVGLHDGRAALAEQTGRRAPLRDALFGVGEVASTWGGGARAGRVAFGAWRHGGRFPSATSARGAVAAGAFASLEQTLWSLGVEGGRTGGAFLRAGGATEAAGVVRRHLASGLAVEGPFASRPADGAGVGISAITLGADAGGRDAREEQVELYYAARMSSWLTLVPDVRMVRHPGGGPGRAAAFTLRTIVSR